MGNCQCSSAKAILEQHSNQINTQLNQTARFGNQSTSIDHSEKRRGKNAIIINTETADIQDNVEFDKDASICSSDITEIKKALKKHFIFSQLSEQEIDCFIKEMRPCFANRNTYIFKQGDKSGAYYILLEGVCQVEINGQKKRTLTFGDTFGDLGIIYNAPRSASVLTVTDCQLVEISRKIFKKVMEDINQLHDKENRKFLEVLSFFKDLTEDQKNAIASCCLSETYEEGQVIFNMGDDANSFYVIKEGTVIIKEKGQELHAMDCFGQNSFLVEGGVRANTIITKTRVKIISMSRQNIKTSLGDSIKNVVRNNMVTKILHQSKLEESLNAAKLKEGVEKASFEYFKKGEIVLKKNSQFKGFILVLLNVELKSSSARYIPNSVIDISSIQDKEPINIKEDFIAADDGTLCKIRYQFEQNAPSPYSVSMKPQEEIVKEDKNQTQKKMQINDFHVVRKLREGNFGKVYACYNTKTSRLYAIKVLDRRYIEKSQIIQYIMNQEQILRTVPIHPFIVGFHKLLKDSNFIYFVMEFIEGEDLFDVLTKSVTFTPDQSRFLIGQVMIMMEHMHTNRIIYRDLKPENIMMNTDGYLKLVDMGTAKRLKIERRFRTNTIIGTPHYIAPQVISGKGYSFPVDLWSLGVISYEMICGKLPFGESSDDPFSIYEEIVNITAKFPRTCPKNSKSFIEKMLSKSPQQRIGVGYQELKRHIFFEGLNWQNLIGKKIEAIYKPAADSKIKPIEIEKALTKQKYKCPIKFLADKASK